MAGVNREARETRETLLSLVQRDAVVRERVTLSSGAESDHYFDLRRVTLSPDGAMNTGSAILDLVKGWKFDAVGGLTMGADPIAVAVMLAAALRTRAKAGGARWFPTAFVVRKEAKQHGLQRRIEGPETTGPVLVVEDVSTTGESALTAVRALVEADIEIAGVASIVDRGGGENIRLAGWEYRALFTEQEVLHD